MRKVPIESHGRAHLEQRFSSAKTASARISARRGSVEDFKREGTGN